MYLNWSENKPINAETQTSELNEPRCVEEEEEEENMNQTKSNRIESNPIRSINSVSCLRKEKRKKKEAKKKGWFVILLTFILVTEVARAVAVSQSALLLRVVISARPTLITDPTVTIFQEE